MPSGVYKHKKGYKRPPFSKEWKKKISERMKGNTLAPTEEKSPQWRGDNAGMAAMHDWVKRWKGRPNHCEMCGITTAKRYDWANVDHTYKRVLDDYIRMCVSCHRKYDRDRGVKINQW
ncbi:MAG TPA: hypothetical protein ENG81_01560 [Candidatus Bathyarchaeota archaeon]|nr:hypothetical protein [Candidatus Bathyarchaeota archaeon]